MSSRAMMQPNAAATAGSKRRVMAGTRANINRSSCERIQPVSHSEQPNGPQAHRGEQNDALDEGLPEGLEIENEEKVANRSENEGAEDRSDRATGAAKERRPADDDRRDRVQRIGPADGRGGFARVGDEGEHQPGNGCQESGKHISED